MTACTPPAGHQRHRRAAWAAVVASAWALGSAGACGTANRTLASSSAGASSRPVEAVSHAPVDAGASASPIESDGSQDSGGEESSDAGPEEPREHWLDSYRSDEGCRDYRVDYALSIYADPHGPKRKFGYDGYGYREVEVSREIDGVPRHHCIRVYHPRGHENADKRRVHVGEHIDAAWYRLIERTMVRIPWWHLQQVDAIVIDNRPILHGVASFSRGAASEDARDGHTIWLHEHLFEGVNHWAPGNYGKYWGYHVQRDGVAVDGQPADHELFSPILLHEIGHLVSYNVVNGSASDPSCPPCAEMCGDTKSCDKLDAAGKEAPCATAYCTGFGHESGTENWAEMYRWYYQGAATRELLAKSFPLCAAVFDGDGTKEGINRRLPAPWTRGLGETDGYRRTLWASCGEKACKER